MKLSWTLIWILEIEPSCGALVGNIYRIDQENNDYSWVIDVEGNKVGELLPCFCARITCLNIENKYMNFLITWDLEGGNLKLSIQFKLNLLIRCWVEELNESHISQVFGLNLLNSNSTLLLHKKYLFRSWSAYWTCFPCLYDFYDSLFVYWR